VKLLELQINGQHVAYTSLEQVGNWSKEGSALRSHGQSTLTYVFTGKLDPAVEILFENGPSAGLAQIEYDHQEPILKDLYSDHMGNTFIPLPLFALKIKHSLFLFMMMLFVVEYILLFWPIFCLLLITLEVLPHILGVFKKSVAILQNHMKKNFKYIFQFPRVGNKLMYEDHEITKSLAARWLVFIAPICYLLYYLLQGKLLLLGNTDHADAQLSYLYAVKNALALGQLAWWNPYIFNGTPIWGSPAIFLWYPPTWIELLAPRSLTLYVSTFISWVHYGGVFLAAFLYFRVLIGDEKWASFSALTYGFSISVAYGLAVGNAHLPIYIFLPLSLYILHSYQQRSYRKNIIFLTISLYCLFTGGFLQFLVYSMLILGTYTLFLSCYSNSRKESFSLIGVFAVSVFITILLSSPIWISTLYMSRLASRFSATNEVLEYILDGRRIAPIYQWMRLILPNGFGFGMWEPKSYYVEDMVAFCGVSSLFLAGMSLVSKPKKTAYYWAGFIILCLLLISTKLLIIQYYAFGGVDMQYGRLVFLLPLGIASLAGMGGKSLYESQVPRWKSLILNPFNALLAVVFFSNRDLIVQIFINAFSMFREFYVNKTITITGSYLPELELLRAGIIILVLVFAFTFITRRKNGMFWIIVTSLLLLEVIPSTYFMHKVQANPLMISPSEPFFAFDKVKIPLPFSASDLEKIRLVITEERYSRKNREAPAFAKEANQGPIYGYQSPWGYANGYSANLATLVQTAGAVDLDLDCSSGGMVFEYKDILYNAMRQVIFDPLCHPRLADLMSVGAVIKADKEWRIVADRRKSALPRASLFYDYEVIPDSTDASNRLTQDDLDIHNTLILEKRPLLNIGPADPEAESIITKNTPNEVVIHVNSKTPALLLLTDTYSPGWTAEIDHQPVEIIRSNVAFRSIWVPKGDHTVVFHFDPPLLGFSLFLELLGVIIFLSVLKNIFIKIPIKKLLFWTALFSPFLFYLIPVFSGYTWSALGPNSFNSLNPPEGYRGRIPDQPITVEPWGASVVNVPYNIRINHYLFSESLPLWNPYQGIGQPFAAQGEGSPYFPLAILRAIIPYSQSNYITFLGFFMAAFFLFLFLRDLGLSPPSAFFGGVTYALSGALSLLIARPNLVDQLSMVPLLFWVTARAVQERKVAWYALLSVVVAINILTGFIQIAILSVLVAGIFSPVYAWWLRSNKNHFPKELFILIGVFVLGIGLATFHILPIAEIIRMGFNKNPEHLASLPIPYANILAFFFPLVWGQFFESWVPGNYPEVVDWNNLFAYAGTGILLLTLAGYSISNWREKIHRNLFLFFSLGGIFLLLRYVSFPIISWVNLLPIINRQSPKHANGLTVFFFVVAAAFAVEYIQSWSFTRIKKLLFGLIVMMVAFVLVLIVQQGGFGVINLEKALQHLFITIIIFLVIVCILHLASKWAQNSLVQAQYALVVMAVAELVLYIPLGNSSPVFLWARIGISGLVLASGLLLVGRRYVMAGISGVITLVFYTVLIILPKTGLPSQFELDQPPIFMKWLQKNTGSNYRTFGIQPETSSIANVQDIGVVGPFALQEYHALVGLISQQDTLALYEGSTVFSLAGYDFMHFDLQQYQQVRPFFDWIGVKYLVLDHSYFNLKERTDHISLFSLDNMRIAYEDDRVTIVESLSVQPKALFSSSYLIFPDQQTILRSLKNDPDQINGPPMLEQSPVTKEYQRLGTDELSSIALSADIYSPNRIRYTFDVPTAGLLVIKDGFYPGWKATIDGKPIDVLRVNGMVRGILVEQSGYHVIEMVYRPQGFIIGIWLFAAISLLFGIGIFYESATRQIKIPIWLLAFGGLLAFLVVWFGIQTYYVM
jgi:hypothetical protein